MKRAARTLATCALLCFAGPHLAFATDVTLPLEQAKIIARQALLAQDIKVANQLAKGILLAEPNNVSALVIIAATAPPLGDIQAGSDAGKRAYNLASDPLLKFEAAYFTAAAAAQQSNYTASKIWLRRAHQAAPDDATRANTEQQFRQVRALDPLQVNLSFSINKTSNINGGSESRFLEVDGVPVIGVLSQTAQALSGYRLSTNVQLSYKLSESQAQKTSLGFSLFSNMHKMSSDAENALLDERNRLTQAGFTNLGPLTRASDFDTHVGEVSLTHLRAPRLAYLPDSYTFGVGTTLYGGSKLYDFARLNLSRTIALSPNAVLKIDAGTTKLFHEFNTSNQKIDQLSVTGLYGMKNGDVLRAGLDFSHSRSDDPNRSYATRAFSLTYGFDETIGPIKLDLGLRVGVTEYDRFLIFTGTGNNLAPGGRTDEFRTFTLGATFSNLSTYGFSPRATLRYDRTKSNISRFERRDWSYNIGFTSTF